MDLRELGCEDVRMWCV